MKLKTTKEIRHLLLIHDVPLAKVLDAQGMSASEYRKAMTIGDFWLALGVSPCTKGHEIKTKSGKCPICNPSTLGFSMRYRNPGWVYLAYSRTGGLAKFGYSTNLKDRIRQLNLHGCGGQKDWFEVACFRTEEAADLEEAIHRALKPSQALLPYLHREGVSREVFRCTLPKAVGIYLKYKAFSDGNHTRKK